ncbi:hypothetical protein V8G54_018308 [Vigna mungo]|uniref:Protein kinase domain-containing protein n=1 Tax=Vigna mungo TaxID=3915 RepID=A0AAQ3N8J6_VIGMU
MCIILLKLLLFLTWISSPSLSTSMTQLDTLLAIRDSLDPENRVLLSWTPHSDPCSTASFEGVACNDQGLVTNISLQGKGLYGRVPEALAALKSLTGLFLHFNALTGILPKEISTLTELSDMYLNVNNLSGDIPREIGNMSNLQEFTVLQLCYNKFSGSIPTDLGRLRKLSVLALQYNQLNSAIPASLGEVGTLARLDLSFNNLFGPIPVTLANAPNLQTLNIRNNSLSGRVPTTLRRLKGGFQYMNNPGLCGTGFADLDSCKGVSTSEPVRPEPYEPGDISTKDLPASIEPQRESCGGGHCKRTSKSSKIGLVFTVIGLVFASTVAGLLLLFWRRSQIQKIGSSDNRLKQVCKKSAFPLISLEYSEGWDPLEKGRCGYSQEFLESFMFNLEEVERATQIFSDVNLLRKSDSSAVYRGVLRDGSAVTIKCIAKTSCKSDEGEFLTGLKILTSLRHENLYLDVKRNSGRVLDWSTRVFIIRGIAKGIDYLHRKKGSKHGIVHQNISAENVLLDAGYKALLADSGLHKLLEDDVVFSALKASAAMGYLPPEYTKTGRLTEKSDVYAFGVIVFQLLTGKRDITQLNCQNGILKDIVDENLEGIFSESEATKLRRVAVLCTHESPHLRPSMDTLMLELDDNE